MPKCKQLSFTYWGLVMKLALSFIAPAMLLNVTTVYSAEDVDTASKEYSSIEEVHIWGTSVKSSSVYMGSSEIAMQQADHISDLLRTIPGVDVGGAHSLNQRITIRSLEDRDIRITIDGASQNNYMYHHMGNLQIHADILQSVNVNVGTNSVIDGGLGGSVQFETKTANQLLEKGESLGARIKTTASTNASNDVAGAIYGENSGLDFLVYYNRVNKSNFRVGGGKIKNADGSEVSGTDGKVRGLEGEVSSALFKSGWDINTHHRIELGYEYYEDKGDYSYRPDMGLATDIAISENTGTPLTWPTEYTRDTFTLNYDGNVGNSEIKLALYDNNSSLLRNERGYAQSSIARFQAWAGVVEGKADNIGLTLFATTILDSEERHTLTYGGDYIAYDTSYLARYDSGAHDRSSEDKKDLAVFIQDRIELHPSFSVTPGLRYDSTELTTSVVNDTFSDLSMALAMEWHASDTLLFRLSSTELYQAPELAEVFVGAGLFDSANADIKAETGLNTEFAVAYSDKTFGADVFTAGGTLFQTRINDYIFDYAAPDPTNARATLKDNVGDMTVDGFELYTGYTLNTFDVLLTYSSSSSELSANEAYSHYDRARLDRSQGDTLSLKLSYELTAPKVKMHWDVMNIDDLDAVTTDMQLDGAGTDNRKSGFTVHNISAQWQATTQMRLTIGVDNVFDKYYVSQSSRTGSSFHPLFGPLFLNDYEPGRNIKGTLSYVF